MKYVKTTTIRRTATRRDVHKALRKTTLLREEELVLRMRLGLPEPGSTRLTFRGQDDDEVAVKLAHLEAEAIAHARPQPPAAAPLEGQALKRMIIEELRKL